MADTFVKLRRGLLEHIPTLTANETKALIYFILEADFTGLWKGSLRARTRDLSRDIGMDREALLAAIHGLVAKQKIRYEPGTNQWTESGIRVLRYDLCDAGLDYRPARIAGRESRPAEQEIPTSTRGNPDQHADQHSGKSRPAKTASANNGNNLQPPKNYKKPKNEKNKENSARASVSDDAARNGSAQAQASPSPAPATRRLGGKRRKPEPIADPESELAAVLEEHPALAKLQAEVDAKEARRKTA